MTLHRDNNSELPRIQYIMNASIKEADSHFIIEVTRKFSWTMQALSTYDQVSNFLAKAVTENSCMMF